MDEIPQYPYQVMVVTVDGRTYKATARNSIEFRGQSFEFLPIGGNGRPEKEAVLRRGCPVITVQTEGEPELPINGVPCLVRGWLEKMLRDTLGEQPLSKNELEKIRSWVAAEKFRSGGYELPIDETTVAGRAVLLMKKLYVQLDYYERLMAFMLNERDDWANGYRAGKAEGERIGYIRRLEEENDAANDRRMREEYWQENTEPETNNFGYNGGEPLEEVDRSNTHFVSEGTRTEISTTQWVSNVREYKGIRFQIEGALPVKNGSQVILRTERGERGRGTVVDYDELGYKGEQVKVSVDYLPGVDIR